MTAASFFERFPVPTRRWLLVAAGLSLIALLGTVRSDGLAWLLVADALWLLALVIDIGLTANPGQLSVSREAPPAFSVGRALPVNYIWRSRVPRPVTLRVKEQFPEPLGGASTPLREIINPAAGQAR
jgi:uncharacterized protein (DUF58 family)